MKGLLLCSCVFILINCKTKEKSKLVLYKAENPVNIVIKSSCKISAITSQNKESDLKDQITRDAEAIFIEMKLRGNTSIKKANYKIKKTEFIITERCTAITPDGKPFIGLQQILVLENIKTMELVEFKSDTIVIDKKALGKPNTLVPEKISLASYSHALTKKNYKQVKKHFSATK